MVTLETPTQKLYTMRTRLKDASAIQVTVPIALVERYALLAGLTTEEFIHEYKIVWIEENENNISVEFVKEKVDVITTNEFLQEYQWRGQNMLWESILAKLKPDEVVKIECDSHQQAKYKQSSLLGSIRTGRHRQFTGKITTTISGNILYIRLKDERELNGNKYQD